MSGGFFSAIAPVAGAVAGGLLNGKGGQQQQTSTQSLDPGIRDLLFQPKGSNMGGLLNDAFTLYNQQNNMGGLSPLQNAGLESQRQFYASPGYAQGFDQQRGVGSGLLGQTAAGNPFTQGRTAGNSAGTQGVQYAPQQAFQPYMPQNNQTLDAANQMIRQISAPAPAAPAQQQQAAAQPTDEETIDAYIKRMTAMQLAQGGG